jgi:hypothetical protein
MQNISHTVPFGENMCSICTANTKQRRKEAWQKQRRKGKGKKEEIKRAEIS